MIIATKQPQGYFISAWMAGVALLMLIVGVHGAVQPLLPKAEPLAEKFAAGDEVMLEQFNPPALAQESHEEQPPIEEHDIEIPPLPVMQPPLTPPEMVEITPLEQPPPMLTKPKLKPKPEPKSVAAPSKPSSGSSEGAITTFTGGGSGSFSSPSYPASARAARQQGSVRLLVTVEASGLPSSVSVETSSGFAPLDAAARDHISRTWRWPAGEVRRYIVPVRFVLKP